MSGTIPTWLEAAISGIRTPRVGFPEQAEWPLTAAAGEIRAARPMDQEHLGARLVVVLETYTDDDPWVNACLVAEAIEVAGDRDIRFDPEESGLSFPVVVESDVVGPLFVVQLGPVLGRIDASLLAAIRSAVHGERAPTLAGRRGTPIKGRLDARWHLKEDEVGTMHALAHACMEHLLRTDVEGGGREAVLDPSLLGDATIPSVNPVLLKALSFVEREGLQLDVPVDRVVASSPLPEWASKLTPDEVRALNGVWQGCLRTDVPDVDLGGRPVQWQPGWAAERADLLTRHLARRAAAGQRAFRILTSRLCWPEASGTTVVALDVEGVGRVQVKPELVEEAA